MIWVDNHGQTPAGKPVATTTFYGQKATIWSSGKNPVSIVLSRNKTSERIHILTMLDWLMGHGYMPKNSGVNLIQFGWELCSTGGKLETFAVKSYDLRLGCVHGGTACYSS